MKPPPGRSRERAAAPAIPRAAAPQGGGAPTVMAGVRRQRLTADVAELKALAPAAAPRVHAAAVRMIGELVAARMTERNAVLWGHQVQKAYAESVTATFSLAQDPVLEQARAWVNRMTSILGDIDLMAVCGHAKGGVFGSLAKAMGRRIDTPRELSAALDELRLLLDRTGTAVERLVQLKERLQKHADAVARTEVEIEAAALAALFLSTRLAAKGPEFGRLFTERAMSLTASLGQARQSSPVYRMQIDQPLQLIAAIQNVALVALPGCLAGMSALLTLLSTKGASPTEARDMSYQLRDVLSQLRT